MTIVVFMTLLRTRKELSLSVHEDVFFWGAGMAQPGESTPLPPMWPGFDFQTRASYVG